MLRRVRSRHYKSDGGITRLMVTRMIFVTKERRHVGAIDVQYCIRNDGVRIVTRKSGKDFMMNIDRMTR